MPKIFFLSGGLFLSLFVLESPPKAWALSVHQVKVQSQADVLVYEVEHDYQADLIVYSSTFPSDGGIDEPYVWYETPLASRAQVKVYYVAYPAQADLLIYVADKPYKVGWVNSSKKIRWESLFQGELPNK